jgi:hypothetical protein
MVLIKRNRQCNVNKEDVELMEIRIKQWNRMSRHRQNKAINRFNRRFAEWDLM